MWGPWQVGQMTKEDYAKKAYQWAKAIKLLDPSVELILCGETGYSSWDSYVIKECIKFDLHGLGGSATASLIDQHSIHIYTAGPDHYSNVTGMLLVASSSFPRLRPSLPIFSASICGACH